MRIGNSQKSSWLARLSAVLSGVLLLASSSQSLFAQDFWGPGASCHCLRKVKVPLAPAQPRIVVTEFFTQGELLPDAHNLAVYDNQDNAVPVRVLQFGPGDFCRIAFQAVPKQSNYKIYYGGPAPRKEPPSWKAAGGLLFETRSWKSCDLNSLQSVRRAFASADPLGSDFVTGVFHRLNPFSPAPESFLSKFEGTIRIPTDGTYHFFTSSQDCSFLLVDGREVVSAPGEHGPVGDARIKGDVRLTAGSHQFEYFHAARGKDACMVAAWQSPKTGQPEIIPASAFGADHVAHLPATSLKHFRKGSLHEYGVEIAGEVALAESAVPLVRVRFHEIPGGGRDKARWDFGDGQSSETTDPVHIYLHPGMYTVKMTSFGGAEIANRVHIHRPIIVSDQSDIYDKLSRYATILAKYEPATLDPAAVLQFVLALEQAGRHALAAKVGQGWLVTDKPDKDENVCLGLARVIGPLLRDSLDDPNAAAAVWQAAGSAVRRKQLKVECTVSAADIFLNDLLQRREAKELLERATADLANMEHSALHSHVLRVWGDWYARNGEKEPARKSYLEAGSARGLTHSTAEQDARRGAFSRSTEAFLRDKDWDRARSELRRWQDEFPADKLEGYLPLLQARFHAGRGKWQNACAVARDLLVVNPDSPYADQLVFLAAECEEKRGRFEQAVTSCQDLLHDYPGSPLVQEVRAKVTQLQSQKAAASSKAKQQ